jgi:hypothetical protein
VTAAAAASGWGCCIRRLLQGKAEGAGSSRGKAEKAGKAESREQRGGGCLFGSLPLSSLFIGGGWLGLRGGCSWAN